MEKEDKTGKNHNSALYSPLALFLGLTLIVLLVVGLDTCKKGKNTDLVIWTYDSFNSEWGPGPDVSKVFEEKTGIKITWISHGDAGEIASRLIQEGDNSNVDIILGIDQNLAPRVLDSGLLEAYRPKGSDKIFSELVLD